ncbi:MAG: hypothetical protein KF796_19265 [Ramlibacter sp.]|nr:hypothetical protein [Ramlibacter sp.]
MTPGERAYSDYFQRREGLNSEGQPLPVWSELPDHLHSWWEATAIRPPGALPWWRSGVFWANAGVLVLAAAEAHVGLLRNVLPGNIFAWVAFALPLANAAVRAARMMRLRP